MQNEGYESSTGRQDSQTVVPVKSHNDFFRPLVEK